MAIQGVFILENIPIRIGMHLGEVVFRNNNVFGDGVNIASRIESIGLPGAVLVSKAIQDQVSNKQEFQLVTLGNFEFKNVEEPIEVFALRNSGFVVPYREQLQGKLKPPAAKKTRWRVISLIGVILTLATMLYWSMTNKSSSQLDYRLASIAILPFDDMSVHKDQEYFSQGIAEEILNTLAQLEELKVAGRTSSFSLRKRELTIGEIGDILGVDHVLEGSIRKQGDKIRITAQLIEVEDEFHLWSKNFDRDFDDIFKIQDELSQLIAEALLEKLVPEQIVKLKGKGTDNSEAYNLYLKAKYFHLNTYYGNYRFEDFVACEKMFNEAISIDSSFALAHAGLADLYDTYTSDVGLDITDQIFYTNQKIKEAKTAVRLNPNHTYVQSVYGMVLKNLSADKQDYSASFEAFTKAFELNPNDVDGITGLASLYADLGLEEDGQAFCNRAIEVDPAFPYSYNLKGTWYNWVGDFESAIEVSKSCLNFEPKNSYALITLVWSHFHLRDYEAALDVLSQIEIFHPDVIERDSSLQQLQALMGGRIELATSIEPDSWHLAYFNEDENELERIFQNWEENEMEEGRIYTRCYYNGLKDHPYYDSFRNEPWFRELLASEKDLFEKLHDQYPRAEEILDGTYNR
jgi:TolB-like protein/Tfp pilus assembly protein PilF